jgi:hypothetical protein
MRKRLELLIVALMLLGPGAARAQTAWDAPVLLPPRPAPGVGIFLTDMHAGGIGVMGMWRSPTWNYGLRVGLSDGGANEDVAVFGGVDYTGPVNAASTDFPIDIDWVLGAGLGVGDGVRLSVPAGLTLGYSFQGEGARFIPYLIPRVILDGWFGNDTRDSDLELGFAVDVGIDVRIMRGNGPLAGRSVRFGASVGDRDAIGLGIVF